MPLYYYLDGCLRRGDSYAKAIIEPICSMTDDEVMSVLHDDETRIRWAGGGGVSLGGMTPVVSGFRGCDL